jgi:diaminohydroxyphosphoribosylaminopyrimidine deaminase/5-amino-6-(5-phosphoribosylamino)uracil reductase
MDLALRLALKGYGTTSPNPLVGAVVVVNGRIIGRGEHHVAGGEHAEVIALKAAKRKAKGATLYVTLEPCCHYGKTPPCTDRIISAGIKRVVIAVQDPNPLVNGKGIKRLRNAGIKVVVGSREEVAKKVNEAFFKYIQTGLPFVTLKLGMSLDGKLATRNGESKWITNEESRLYVHQLRAGVDAILVGKNTVINDNPELTVRLPGFQGKQPKRFILDTQARVPLSARIFQARFEPKNTILVTTKKAAKNSIKRYARAGIPVWILPVVQQGINLRRLMQKLGKEQVQSVLVEGGATIAWSCLAAGIIDKVIFFLAPKLIGGQQAPSAIGGKGFAKLSDAIQLTDLSIKRIGSDIKIEGYINKSQIPMSNKSFNQKNH